MSPDMFRGLGVVAGIFISVVLIAAVLIGFCTGRLLPRLDVRVQVFAKDGGP